MSWKDTSWVECLKVNLIVGWRLFMKSLMDWSCLVVPRKIKKMSSMNLFQKDGFFVAIHEEVGKRWGSFGSQGCADKLTRMPTHE